ncbi:hypothetical protein [Euzebya sp.]|uniref:hypothetical protein n=1 Tax=Euzebya sp. TaxID=1971409 RepID=UPI003511BD9B
MELPAAIAVLAARNPGRVFCRKQVFRAGYRDTHLTAWLREGLIERLAPGWYRIVDDLVPVLQDAWLAQSYMHGSSGRPRPVISGAAALEGYGVTGIAPRSGRPVLLVQRGDRVRIATDPFHVLHADLTRTERVLHRGLWLAGPARALADLVVEWGDEDVQRLIDAVDATRNHMRLLTVDLMAAWAALPRHPGAALLLELAEAGTFDVDSQGERLALDEVFSRCAHLPDCQVTVLPNIRVDFIYVFAALVIEYYGWVHDGRADTDATRMMALELGNCRTLVMTKSMIHEPIPIAAHIDRVREEREGLVLAGKLRPLTLPPQPPRRVPLRTTIPLG